MSSRWGWISDARRRDNDSKVPLCRYYLTPRGCRFGTACRFSHDSSAHGDSNNQKKGNENADDTDNGYNAQQMAELLLFFQEPNCYEYVNETSKSRIIHLIDANKTSVLFTNLIAGTVDKRSNLLVSAIDIMANLDGDDYRQNIWFEITQYLFKQLNEWLQSRYCLQVAMGMATNDDPHCAVIRLLRKFRNSGYQSEQTTCCLFTLLRQLLHTNSHLNIALFYLTASRHISPSSRYASNASMSHQLLSEFPSPALLFQLFRSVGFGRILPFSAAAGIATETKQDLNYIWAQMPLHWMVISVRVFRDVYWNEVQLIITTLITMNHNEGDDDDNEENGTEEWNLDVMQCIVEYVGDENALDCCDNARLYKCEELEDVDDVIRCLKIFNRTKSKYGCGLNVADDALVEEWLNYFVKHRRYKHVPRSMEQLKTSNRFLDRALHK